MSIMNSVYDVPHRDDSEQDKRKSAAGNKVAGQNDRLTNITFSFCETSRPDGYSVLTDREACLALPPDVPAKDALSARNTDLLRRLEAWLRTSESEPAVSPTSGELNGGEPCVGEPGIGLYQLYEALASQRQELKLYTKTGRQMQEQLAKCIEETSAAVTMMQRYDRDKADAEMPFLSSLMEMDESLERAAAAVLTMQQRLTELFGTHVEHAAAWCDRLSSRQRFGHGLLRWWHGLLRWWHRRYSDQQFRLLRRHDRTVRAFAAFVAREQQTEAERIFQPFRDGFGMLRQRMNDILKKHEIVRLEPCGEPVDPQTMRVIAVVESECVPPGHVVDVIRPGYLRRGKPIRFADVRAAR
ncbi:MAG: nucleotide exchange factor GrpE [Planctomycetaceae bacterium]|nr:nucleotide exchange factor GrpE [Planctomycetaceae bacterium]